MVSPYKFQVYGSKTPIFVDVSRVGTLKFITENQGKRPPTLLRAERDTTKEDDSKGGPGGQEKGSKGGPGGQRNAQASKTFWSTRNIYIFKGNPALGAVWLTPPLPPPGPHVGQDNPLRAHKEEGLEAE